MSSQKLTPIVPDEMYEAGSSSSSTALVAHDVFEHPRKNIEIHPWQCGTCGRQYQSEDAAKHHYYQKHSGHRPVPDEVILLLDEDAPYRVTKKRRYRKSRAEDEISHQSTRSDAPETRNRAHTALDLNPAVRYRSNAPNLPRPRLDNTVLGKRTFTKLQAGQFQSQFAQSYVQNRALARQGSASVADRSDYLPFNAGGLNNPWQTGRPTSGLAFSQNVQDMNGLNDGPDSELDYSLITPQNASQLFSGQDPIQSMDASDPDSQHTDDFSNDASNNHLYGLGLDMNPSFDADLETMVQNDEIIFPQSDSTYALTQQYGAQLLQTNMPQHPQDAQSPFGHRQELAGAGVNNFWTQTAQQDARDAQLYLEHGQQLPVTEINDAWTQTEEDPTINMLLQQSRDLQAQLQKVEAERDSLKVAAEQKNMDARRRTPTNPQMTPALTHTIDITQQTTPVMPQMTNFAPQHTLVIPQTTSAMLSPTFTTPHAAYALPQTTAFAQRVTPIMAQKTSLHTRMRPSDRQTPSIFPQQEQSLSTDVESPSLPDARDTVGTAGSARSMLPSDDTPQPTRKPELKPRPYPFLDLMVRRGEVSGPATKRKPRSLPLAEHMPLPPGVAELNPLPRPPPRFLPPSATRPSSQSGSSGTTITQETRATRRRRQVEGSQPEVIAEEPGQMSRVSNSNAPYDQDGESYRLSGRRRQRWDVNEGEWVPDPAPRFRRRLQ